MSDKNYISIAGNVNGELFLTDLRLPVEQQVRRLRAPFDFTRVVLDLGVINPPSGYSDALKFSGAINVEVTVDEIFGGSEDCIDVNHSSDIVVNVGRAVPRGRYYTTTKGGSRNIEINTHELASHAKYTDHDTGNWSDQSDQLSTDLRFSTKYAGSGNEPVRIRVLHATRPLLLNAQAQAYIVHMPFWRVWFYPVMSLLKKLKLA